MFGFPIGNGNSGADDFLEKFTNNADSGFPKIQQREIFYSVKDGNWDDVTIWQTASGRIGKIPGQFDDVYVKHQVGLNPNFTINNLFVSGRIYAIAGNRTYNINGNLFINHDASYDNNLNNGIAINIFGDIKCFGSFTMNNNSHILRLYGQNNYIEKSKFTSSVSSAVHYERVGNQNVLDLNYGTLNVYRPGTKTLQGNTIVQGSLTCQGDSDDLIFELGGYDFSVLGSTFIFRGSIKRSTSSPILFVGNVLINGNSVNSRPFILDGNCSVEFRGGISNGSNQPIYILGSSGTFNFTTNNQSISGNANDLFIDNPILIGTGVTLTMASSARVYLNNTINGADSTSTLLMGLNGQMYFNTLASVPSMTTGVWNFTTNANTVGYTGNYTATIPSYFTTFHNLTISGTGTKSLGVNTTINNNLSVTGTIDFATYDITINGTSTIPNNPGKIMKSGSGNVTFIGLLTIGTAGNNGGTLDFSGGNPNVEFRNGINGDYSNAVTFKSGTGTWRFTTNNQKLGRLSAGGIWNYDCSIQIENIVLSVQADGGGSGATNVFKNSVNGTTAGSSLINYSTIEFQGPTTFMTTGTFDFTTNANLVIYNTSTSFVVPYGSYWGLSLRGTGSKTLSQNTTCFGNFQASGTPVDFTTYNVDIYGTTLVGYTTLRKSGAGNITFRGLVNTEPQAIFNFSGGNPNVEFRGGITFIYNGSLNSGTGTWSFTTNNQTIQINGISNNYQFDCTISIVNINLTMNSNNRTFTFTNPINGTTGTSQLTIAATSTINYQSATQPMITGILDTSTNANTWIYGSGNQDIKGNTYRNLTFNGGGTKTLQGNVSVLNTYTLTAPATVNLNGFTLTNP